MFDRESPYISYRLSSRRPDHGMPFSTNTLGARVAFSLLGLFIAGSIGTAVAVAIFYAVNRKSITTTSKISSLCYPKS